MKVQFMKKLVPLALIASIAATNVGLTSVAVSAQETAVVQSVEGAPVVGGTGSSIELENYTDGEFAGTPREIVFATSANATAYFKTDPTAENPSNPNTNKVNVEFNNAFQLYKKYNKGDGSLEDRYFKEDEVKLFYFTTTGDLTDKLDWIKITNYNTENGNVTVSMDLEEYQKELAIGEGIWRTAGSYVSVDLVYPKKSGEESEATVARSGMKFQSYGTPFKFDLKSVNKITRNVTTSADNEASSERSYKVYDSNGTEVEDFEVTDDATPAGTGRRSKIEVSLKDGSELKTTPITKENARFYYLVQQIGSYTPSVELAFYVVNDIADLATIKQVTGGYSIPAGTTLNLAWDNETQKIKLAKVNDKDSEQVLTDSLTGLYQFVKGADDKETKTDIESGRGFQTVAGTKGDYSKLDADKKAAVDAAGVTAGNKWIDDNWDTIKADSAIMTELYAKAVEAAGTTATEGTAGAIKTAGEAVVAAKTAAQQAEVAGWAADKFKSTGDSYAFSDYFATYYPNADDDDGSIAVATDKKFFEKFTNIKNCVRNTESVTLPDNFVAAVVAKWTKIAGNGNDVTGVYASDIANIDVSSNTDYLTACKAFLKVENTALSKNETLTNQYAAAVDAGKDELLETEEYGGTTGGLDTSQFRWVVEEVSPDKNGYTVAAKNGKLGNKTDVTNADTVTIKGTKASGNFNSSFVLKFVSKDYAPKSKANSDAKGKVFASFNIYVTPAVATDFKALDTTKVAKPAKKIEFATSSVEGIDYALSLPVDAAVKIPFQLDGKPANKNIIYEVGEGSTGFQVIGGQIKGLSNGGSGTITCYAESNPDVKKVISVKVTSGLKNIRANTNKVTVYPGSEQTIYLGTTPASLDTTFKVGGSTETSGDIGSFASWTLSGNALTITAKSGVKKGDKGDLSISADGLNKAFKITVSGADAPLNAKSIKSGIKKKKGQDFIDVDVPLGTVKNIGITMQPATCDADFTWADVAGDIEGANGRAVDEPVTITKTVEVDGFVLDPTKDTQEITGFGTVTPGTNVEQDSGASQGATAKTYAEEFVLVEDDDTTYTPKATVTVADGKVTIAKAEAEKLEAGKSYDVAQKVKTYTMGESAWDNGADSYEVISANAVKIATVTEAGTATETVNALQISGDVVKGNAIGTYYVQYTSESRGEDGDPIVSDIYRINVYTPGSNVIFPQKTDQQLANLGSDVENFTLVGNTLMSSEEAATTCSKTLEGGKTYKFPAPVTAGEFNEPISWSCNKPAAVIVSVNDGVMSVTPLQTGKFNIVGETKYTKKKFTFKVETVAKAADIEAKPTASDYEIRIFDSEMNDWVPFAADNVKIAVKADAKFAVFPKDTSEKKGAIGTVKFSAGTPDSGTMNAGTGVLKGKAAGTTTIKADITLTKGASPITVESAAIEVEAEKAAFTKITVPSGIVAGSKAKFTAAVKNVKVTDVADKIFWKAVAATGAFENAAPGKDNDAWGDSAKISGATELNWAPTECVIKEADKTTAATYWVCCEVDGVRSDAVLVKVYPTAQALKNPTTTYKFTQEKLTADPSIYTVADVEAPDTSDEKKAEANKKKALTAVNNAYAKAIANLKGKDASKGQGAGYGVYYIPIFADVVTDGATLTNATDLDIEWTSSNVNLAEATTVVYNASNVGLEGGLIDKAASAAYAIAKITTCTAETGYTGKVDLTGVLKNSGKKVKVTLNLTGTTGSTDEPVTPKYAPAGILYKNVGTENGAGLDVYGTNTSADYTSATAKVVDLDGNEITGLSAVGSSGGKFSLRATAAFEDGKVFRIEVLGSKGSYEAATDYKTVTVYDTTPIAIDLNNADTVTAIESGLTSGELPETLYIQMVGNSTVDLTTVQGSQITAERNTDATKFNVTTTGEIDETKVYILSETATGGTKIEGTNYFYFTAKQ